MPCLGEANSDLWGPALTSMIALIRAATTSMTSVPKPLKFMIPHFDAMKEVTPLPDPVLILISSVPLGLCQDDGRRSGEEAVC